MISGIIARGKLFCGCGYGPDKLVEVFESHSMVKVKKFFVHGSISKFMLVDLEEVLPKYVIGMGYNGWIYVINSIDLSIVISYQIPSKTNINDFARNFEPYSFTLGLENGHILSITVDLIEGKVTAVGAEINLTNGPIGCLALVKPKIYIIAFKGKSALLYLDMSNYDKIV